MEELKWFDKYAGQSTDELIALEGKYRTDSIVLAFENAVECKAMRDGDSNLTDEERIILAVEALEREVNNGGYDQFFTNTTKEFTPIVVNALNRIGCKEMAVLTQEAINILGINGPITVKAIDSIMNKYSEDRSEKLHECDNRYYKIVGDLAKPLLEFIKSNKEKIILS